ncbi:hypothetical protein [Bifidobacterium sp. SO1]|uniref:hypothetical protein n=1 Tax=Bifidobacterium sp. SO1 TaxID=2809029 RepID=UPI001BDCAFC3|nr:hypothetical protein [Bifidobacterium sp. SO1]MBT1160934.1 hypothetical protein [Bifidobacterium sp. SO1]
MSDDAEANDAGTVLLALALVPFTLALGAMSAPLGAFLLRIVFGTRIMGASLDAAVTTAVVWMLAAAPFALAYKIRRLLSERHDPAAGRPDRSKISPRLHTGRNSGRHARAGRSTERNNK